MKQVVTVYVAGVGVLLVGVLLTKLQQSVFIPVAASQQEDCQTTSTFPEEVSNPGSE